MSAAATRVDVGPAGDIDDLFIDAASFQLARAGVARYRLDIFGVNGDAHAIQLWTTQKGRIDVIDVNEQLSESGLQHEVAADGLLQSLSGGPCQIHLEQLDRGYYLLDFSAATESLLMLYLESPGYIKVRRIDGSAVLGGAVLDSAP